MILVSLLLSDPIVVFIVHIVMCTWFALLADIGFLDLQIDQCESE